MHPGSIFFVGFDDRSRSDMQHTGHMFLFPVFPFLPLLRDLIVFPRRARYQDSHILLGGTMNDYKYLLKERRKKINEE